MDKQCLFKISVIGDSSVGKTSLVAKYAKNIDANDPEPTIGIDFLAKAVRLGEQIYRLQMWDTAGQERFQSLIPSYIRNADGIVVVYDITNRKTFENLKIWFSILEEEKSDYAVIALVGNKHDCTSKRQVSLDEGRAVAKENGCLFTETSAKNGKNIDGLFLMLLQKLVDRREKLKRKKIGVTEPIDIAAGPRRKRSCPCAIM